MFVTLQAQPEIVKISASGEKPLSLSGILIYYSNPNHLLPYLESWPVSSRITYDMERLCFYEISPCVTFVSSNVEETPPIIYQGVLRFENPTFTFSNLEADVVFNVHTAIHEESNKRLLCESGNVCKVPLFRGKEEGIEISWEHITKFRKIHRPAALACSWIGALCKLSIKLCLH